MRLTLEEVAVAVGGVVPAAGASTPVTAAIPITSVSIDSRTLAPGGLFVALVGERDGHDFVPAALAAGAAAALVSRPVAGVDGPCLIVADTAVALSALGREARRRLGATPVIGITGSSGKTSTKDLTAAALASLRPWASEASFNNELGVPLTLLAAVLNENDDRAGAVVVEMEPRGAGHIALLCSVAAPTVGVVVNIGTAHAEFFGSRADVAQAKGELVEALSAAGHAILNADDDMSVALAARTDASVITAGAAADADVRISGLTLDGDLRPSFHLDTPWGPADVERLPLRGAHQAGNAALAVATAGVLGVAPDVAAADLAGAVGSRWRMELSRSSSGVVVLNDAYNANPASMAAALEALARLDVPGRRFAVVGYMAAGPGSAAEHHRVGSLAGAGGLDGVIVVGSAAAPMADGAREAGVEAVLVETTEEALAVLRQWLRPGDAILVKASRVAGLEQVAAAVLENCADWRLAPPLRSSGDPAAGCGDPNPDPAGAPA